MTDRPTTWPTFRTGLNPYGLAYHLGLQGRGTERANPSGRGLEGFLALAEEIGAKAIEIFDPWMADLSDSEMQALKDRLAAADMVPIVSGSFVTTASDNVFRSARLLGAKTIRFALTNVLCGDRAARDDWDDLRADVAKSLTDLGRKAVDQGVMIGIENHQDFTSAELVEFCGLSDGGIGITYDTGNSFPVGESPLDFTRTVAPHVVHLHLKDYRAQPTPEGFRLVRCAIGDGAVPFADLFGILGQHRDTLNAVLEPGALEARHVRLFTPGWWQGYAPRAAPDLAACLLAVQRNRLGEGDDYRTPWELKSDGDVEAFELAMIRRSADNMKSLGIL